MNTISLSAACWQCSRGPHMVDSFTQKNDLHCSSTFPRIYAFSVIKSRTYPMMKHIETIYTGHICWYHDKLDHETNKASATIKPSSKFKVWDVLVLLYSTNKLKSENYSVFVVTFIATARA